MDNLQQLANALEEYIKGKNISQNQAAKKMGIKSPSYITHILAGNFDKIPAGKNSDGSPRYTRISDQVIKKVSNFLRIGVDVWETKNYKEIMTVLIEAKHYSEHRIIDGSKGLGKTFTAKQFKKQAPNETYLITCSEDMNPKSFMVELANLIGSPSVGDRRTIRLRVAEKIKKMNQPIIIVDEAENLKPSTYGSIKALYDDVEDYCGIVLIGANDYLKRLKKQADAGRSCFPQLYSRFSADPAMLHPMSYADVKDVCLINGINEKQTINMLFDQCADFRELDRMIKRINRDNELHQNA